MNLKQQRFCEEYLIDFNKKDAAIRAGYSEKSAVKTAERILNLKEAQDFIDGKMEKVSGKKTAEAAEVLEYFTAVMRGEKWGKGGEEAGESKTDKAVTVRDRMKAAELIAKLYGMFGEKADTQDGSPVVIFGESDLED